LQRLVGDADLVGVGVAERHQARGRRLGHLVGLAPDVAGRLLHRLEDSLDLLVEERGHGRDGIAWRGSGRRPGPYDARRLRICSSSSYRSPSAIARSFDTSATAPRPKYSSAAVPTARVAEYAIPLCTAQPATGMKSSAERASILKPNPAPSTESSSNARSTDTSSPWQAAICRTIRICTAVSTGMSAPGTKIISAAFAFRRAAASITPSTIRDRSAGTCDATQGPLDPTRSASMSIARLTGKWPWRYGMTSCGSTPRTRPAAAIASLGRSSASSI